MDRRISILALVLLLGMAGACSKSEMIDPAEVAWSELVEAWGDVETAEEKAQLAEEYLSNFPDTEHSGSMAGAVVHYRGHEMGDPQGAVELVASALEKIEDPEQRFEASMELLSLADSVHVPLDLGQVADDLATVRALDYDEHQRVFETAADLERWALAAKHASAATDLATAEDFRAGYPDREFTDEQVAPHVSLRKATSLAYEGWAAYNLGDVERAFDRFATADEVGSVNYLGVPKTPLYMFWGRAALAEGDVNRAIELLGAETLFSEDGSRAKPYLREAYVAKNGDEEGFEEFLWATRNQLATPVDDFTLLDYQGNEVSLAEVSAGKVTLLAFWFPT